MIFYAITGAVLCLVTVSYMNISKRYNELLKTKINSDLVFSDELKKYDKFILELDKMETVQEKYKLPELGGELENYLIRINDLYFGNYELKKENKELKERNKKNKKKLSAIYSRASYYKSKLEKHGLFNSKEGKKRKY